VPHFWRSQKWGFSAPFALKNEIDERTESPTFAHNAGEHGAPNRIQAW
jgi:hypothetical protein